MSVCDRLSIVTVGAEFCLSKQLAVDHDARLSGRIFYIQKYDSHGEMIHPNNVSKNEVHWCIKYVIQLWG